MLEEDKQKIIIMVGSSKEVLRNVVEIVTNKKQPKTHLQIFGFETLTLMYMNNSQSVQIYYLLQEQLENFIKCQIDSDKMFSKALFILVDSYEIGTMDYQAKKRKFEKLF